MQTNIKEFAYKVSEFARVNTKSSIIIIAILAMLIMSPSIFRDRSEEQRQERYTQALTEYTTASGTYHKAEQAMQTAKQCMDANSHTGTLVDCGSLQVDLQLPKASANPSYNLNATGGISPVASWLTPTENSAVILKELTPNQLFYTTNIADKCALSQTDKQHFVANGRHAVDIVCNFWSGLGKQAQIYAPDFRDESVEYTVTNPFKSKITGDTIDLWFTYQGTKFFWRLGHTESNLKNGDKIKTGQRIGQMNLSGMTSGYHNHLELWVNTGWQYSNIDYSTRSQNINNLAKNTYPKRTLGEKYYFTHYDLGDVNQNDKAPCTWASWKNQCDLEKKGIRTMALTIDVRNSLGVKFGDKVELIGDHGCQWQYQVEDEMNERYRFSDIHRDGVPIKGDLPSMDGGVCTVAKIN